MESHGLWSPPPRMISGELSKMEFDARTVGAFKRERAWASMMNKCFYEYSTSYPLEFRDGRLSVGTFGDVCTATVQSDPMTVSREATHIAADPRDYYFVLMPAGGPISLSQRGCQAIVERGELALVGTTQPYQYEQASHETFHVLLLPGAPVRERCAAIEDIAATRLPSRGLIQVFLDYAKSVLRNLPELSADEARDLLHQLYDLLALAVAGADHNTRETSVRLALRHRATALIEERFHDPDFRPASIAYMLRISERYLQRIFAENGQTPSNVLRNRRIREACLQIGRRDVTRKSIAEIAYNVGFLDPAHFSRVFRNKTGIAPSEYTRNGE